uniref:Uncharacterized protein n=1 Tax=Arundo donax TaxID=35708 RepID=A0A0A9GMY0_ARUDO
MLWDRKVSQPNRWIASFGVGGR